MATNNELVLANLTQSIAKKSLKNFSKARVSRSVLLIDTSSSMNGRIESGGSKVEAMRAVVKELRNEHPVPVIAFGGLSEGDDVKYSDGVPEPHGMTPMHHGINFARKEGATHIVLVTDGEPDSETLAMDAAVAFGGVIDTFYIGDPNTDGAQFAAALAKATGGSSNVTTLSEPKQLATKIAGLLPAMPANLLTGNL